MHHLDLRRTPARMPRSSSIGGSATGDGQVAPGSTSTRTVLVPTIGVQGWSRGLGVELGVELGVPELGVETVMSRYLVGRTEVGSSWTSCVGADLVGGADW